MDPIYTMTEEEARKQLEEDIRNRFPSDIVNVILENHGTLTQNQLDALVALGFNNGKFTPARSPKFTEVLKEKDYFDEEIRMATRLVFPPISQLYSLAAATEFL